MFNKKLKNKDLKNVSGGKSNLDDYLKKLVAGDKNKILVDSGGGTQLKPDSTISYEDDSKLIVIKRENGDPDL